jgi:predicted nucleic acid-binding protein
MKFFMDTDICLDLLDTTRPTSEISIRWYQRYSAHPKRDFFFSGNAITTLFRVLTRQYNVPPKNVVEALDALTTDATPIYFTQLDFLEAKKAFSAGVSEDFEKLMELASAARNGCDKMVTYNSALSRMSTYRGMKFLVPVREKKVRRRSSRTIRK